MPYTNPDDRITGHVVSVGDLNYQIHQLIDRHLPNNPSYAQYNGVLGVLVAVQMELYRRLIAPYEFTKSVQNGDCRPYNNRRSEV